MKNKFIINPNKDFDEWENFVERHPNANIFQTPYIYHIYKKTPNHDPIAIIMQNNSNELIGVLLADVQYFMNGFFKILSSRSVVWGGPLVKNNDSNLMNEILIKYEEIIKNKVIFNEIRNIFEIKDKKEIYKSRGYIYEDHLNIIVNLKKSIENLWEDVHTKRRNEIRRALKEGTTFSEIKNHNQLLECYKILEEVYNRIRLPLPHKSLFAEAFYTSNINRGLKVFTALYNKKIIGTLFALYYKDIIYDWYAGSYKSYYSKHPNDLLPWEVFKWGKSNGYKIFDFGGAGKPNEKYGVRNYKLKFGGTMVNYGRFRKIYKPLLLNISNFGFKFSRLLEFTNRN